MVNQYLDTKPDPGVLDFLRYNFDELTSRCGGVAGLAFRGFPSYPQRYSEVLDPQPPPPADHLCRVEPLKVPRVSKRYTEDDLAMREFLRRTSRRLMRKGQFRAA
jgi:hypothetical protein